METATAQFKSKEWNLHRTGRTWRGVSADKKLWGEFVQSDKGNFINLFFRPINMEDRQQDIGPADPNYHEDSLFVYC